ncbi:polyphosphate kinase 2 [Naasia aerilata]|nr:polyphosphate kinase 2 [Naasia aerilata]
MAKAKTKAKAPQKAGRRVPKDIYEAELERLQVELVRMQQWIVETGARVVVIFEGRDAAGKGGAIKRVVQYLNPRSARVVALPAPSERERGQWYFQRYIERLPAAGEIVLMDRSWYNRAGVERVMEYCTQEQYDLFLKQTPVFERMLVEDGIILIKYWFSVSDKEQEKRFKSRLHDPMRRWKLSETDLASIVKWEDYSRAKDAMFSATDLPEARWWTIESDDKRASRLNAISHLLSQVEYEAREPEKVVIPPRPKAADYQRPPRELHLYVPDYAATL